MLEAPAATMPSPKLKYGNRTFTPTNSSWNLANLKFLATNSKTIFKMCIIAVPERDEDSLLTGAKITESLKAFQKALQGSTASPRSNKLASSRFTLQTTWQQ
jgi:hypothetical protein